MSAELNEDRPLIWEKYLSDGGQDHSSVRHMFVSYTRYYEANLVRNHMSQNGYDLRELRVLDYGCGVGDYGIHLARDGASVDFYDYPRATRFVTYRLGLEDLTNGQPISADHVPFEDFHKHLGQYDLIIFGEVLEHLHNPLAIIKMCNLLKVKHIFTSSYPYRSDDPNDPYWHNHDHEDDARKMMPECREIFEENYVCEKYSGELRMWTRK